MVVVAAVGLWGTRKRCPQVHRRTGSRSGSGGQRTGIDDPALRVVVGEAVRPPKHRQPTVRVFVDADLVPDEVRTQRRPWDLQGEAFPLDGVVVADDALFLDAEDLAPAAGSVGDEGGALLFRRLGKAGVVLRQIDLGQPAVGGFEGGNPGQPQLPSAGGPAALGRPARSGRALPASRRRCARCRAA